MTKQVVLIVHNVRSAHNVGSLLRTADGLGIEKVYLTGYTPYPASTDDERMPHLAAKLEKQINKTALGAQKTVEWEHQEDIVGLIDKLKGVGYVVAALEQSPESVKINGYKTPSKVALIVGREIEGIEPEILDLTDVILEIPMHGNKESFNVAVAAAIGLYVLKTSA